jgi:hypothetical protein
MPTLLVELLEIPAVREGLLDLIIWLLAQSQINPTFAADYTGLITQLKSPNLSAEERQSVLAKLNSLHAT